MISGLGGDRRDHVGRRAEASISAQGEPEAVLKDAAAKADGMLKK
jgi:hypothetical protein